MPLRAESGMMINQRQIIGRHCLGGPIVGEGHLIGMMIESDPSSPYGAVITTVHSSNTGNINIPQAESFAEAEHEVTPGWRHSQYVDGTGRVTAIIDSDGNMHPLAHPEVVESLIGQEPTIRPGLDIK